MSRILSGDERLSTEAHVGVGDAQLWPALTASASGHGGVRGWGEEGGVAPVPPVPLAASTSAWPLQTAWSPRALPQAANPAFLSEDHRASFCPLQGWFDSGPRVCGFLRMMARAVIPGDSPGRRGFHIPGYNARLRS